MGQAIFMHKYCSVCAKMCKIFARFRKKCYLCTNFLHKYRKSMKKIFSLLIVAFATSASVMAGGLLTNTNQNAAYLRNFAQEGQIDITAMYANPAGIAFLDKGWHLSVNTQSAFQRRIVDTTFPYFVLNDNNKNQTHNFTGKATAPVIPSFSVSYNHDKWSVGMHFGLTGGGGKCEFEDGLGSFESLYSSTLYNMIPGVVQGQIAQGIAAQGVPEAMAQQIAATGTYGLTGYNMDLYMKGTSYYFGLQVGGTYKILDNLAVYGGIRFVYANTNYQGHVKNIVANYGYSVPAIPGAFPGLQGTGTQSLPDDVYGIDLNCDQSGFGVTPILGIDWKVNDKWNVSAKYEFKTRMRLNNSTSKYQIPDAAAGNPTLEQFKDGKSVKEDIPGILAIGAQYKPFKAVKLNVGYKWYQDSKATKNNDMHNYVNDSHEIVLGGEWKFCKWVAASFSWQKTMYDMQDEFMNDVSFNNSSNSIGCGFRIYPCKKVNIDLGYMHTMYQDRTVTTYAGQKTDVYNRRNDVFGVGVNLAL